jgi:hypothetical protein
VRAALEVKPTSKLGLKPLVTNSSNHPCRVLQARTSRRRESTRST